MSNWTLFSNHGHVLVCLARDPEARLRDVAAAVGITERAVQKIVRDLQQSDMISVSKQGRRNQYRIHRKAGLRHELEADSNVGGLIDFVSGKVKTVKVAAKPAESAATAILKKDKKATEPASPAVVDKVRTPVEPVTPAPVNEAKLPDVAARSQDESVAVKQKEAADTGETAESVEVVKKEKVAKKAKEQSEIEKQQGSLF